MIRHLLTGREFDRPALEQLIETTAKLKAGRGKPGQPRPLDGKSIGMIFSKSSTRTRVSFEVGIHELGGQPIYLDESKTQMGRGETIADTARVLSRFLHGIVIRTFRQSDVEGLAQYGSIPIVNALTDDYHPCQAFADLFTIWERKGRLEGLKMAYLGDGASNMANSLMMACKLAGMTFSIGAPEEFRPRQTIMDEQLGPGMVEWTTDPVAAMKDADFVYTDVWVSMGFEKESRERMRILEPYRLDMKMLGHAKPDVKVMHCLPAHRGEEITDEVMESAHSIVFDEAENRLHMHKAILCTLFQ
ncbi:MAG: ornithine carbamoyltransferase [Lentisphaeria bacterium]|nr:ornithine carbamoyltransferase [Lentisphaeria bacterium]